MSEVYEPAEMDDDTLIHEHHQMRRHEEAGVLTTAQERYLNSLQSELLRRMSPGEDDGRRS